eukprot:CAMPEP_0170454162 /NCGR_PEP_ID=MMETSP0123-20130129/2511_1 /TAXON_ID=182087 /ORGANISM="Favella ehrenbergii, Strain Fehren 1" /LENGTH=68 /DNA_ID=CAMNT_0010716793 /DNA_START=1617 /DNA_END=1823 /DNA_ORIENTATION=+
MKESEMLDMQDHNQLHMNMQAMDHSSMLRKEQRRRMNEQNQQYLRIQMKQKEDDAKFNLVEKRKHRDR